MHDMTLLKPFSTAKAVLASQRATDPSRTKERARAALARIPIPTAPTMPAQQRAAACRAELAAMAKGRIGWEWAAATGHDGKGGERAAVIRATDATGKVTNAILLKGDARGRLVCAAGNVWAAAIEAVHHVKRGMR